MTGCRDRNSISWEGGGCHGACFVIREIRDKGPSREHSCSCASYLYFSIHTYFCYPDLNPTRIEAVKYYPVNPPEGVTAFRHLFPQVGLGGPGHWRPPRTKVFDLHFIPRTPGIHAVDEGTVD